MLASAKIWIGDSPAKEFHAEPVINPGDRPLDQLLSQQEQVRKETNDYLTELVEKAREENQAKKVKLDE